MERGLADLVWRGVEDANPWWRTGRVPGERTQPFRRDAFAEIHRSLISADRGRGLVVLGPRRVGKTILLHQIVEQVLQDGTPPRGICLLAMDDVALRGQDLGELLLLLETRNPAPGRTSGSRSSDSRPLLLLETRNPAPGDRPRILLLDEIQHSPDWSGWLKRLADRRDPYIFLATGSSATALVRGGQDAGVGRWREMTLFPWSFREHVALRNLPEWSFEFLDKAIPRIDKLLERPMTPSLEKRIIDAVVDEMKGKGPPPPDEIERLDAAMADYFVRGGFPEVAAAPDLAEARRRLRQDILDRALGRDVLDTMSVDTHVLERLFVRICKAPGGLWNEVEVARDLGVSRPTVAKYLQVLEHALLVFRFPNLASPIKGQPKVYLVAPALRQALFAYDEAEVRRPEEWGVLTENAVVASIVGTRQPATEIGFWRRGKDECDIVVHLPTAQYIEVKRGGEKAVRGMQRAAEGLGLPGTGLILTREAGQEQIPAGPGPLQNISKIPAAMWLYMQRASAGGTLRVGAR